jgi:cytochrome c551/c552
MKKYFLMQILSISFLFANDGELLFNGNCITCHNINKDISAPSIKEVQKRYKKAFEKKEDFINYMSSWVIEPSEERSIMLDKIKKYKLMPLLGYEEVVVREIASYIYDTKF